MHICGKDGTELRCCKTGLTLHDTNYKSVSRFQADLHFCPVCKMLYINRAREDYFDENSKPLLVIDKGRLVWDEAFAVKIKLDYGVTL